MIKKVTLWLLAGIVSTCTTVLPSSPPPVRPVGSPDEAWARVLQRAVDAQGRINFALVARDRADLDTYLAYVAQASPHSHPALFSGRREALAYYINSYNALAMYGVIARQIPRDFKSFLTRIRFFVFTAYRVGGKTISLYDYENTIIRPLGEPRVHFALNCMVIGCPRLPQVPFCAQELDQQLEAAATEFCNTTKHVQLDPERRVVRFSAILRWYTKDFVNASGAPSLIAYVNRYRAQKIPADFAVEFLPYDWTVNKQ
jgi:hypothetical protein